MTAAESGEIRTSVLEAALDLGVESPTFTEWMSGGASLSSATGNPLAGDRATPQNNAFPFNSSPGDTHHPYSKMTPIQVNYQSQVHSESRYPPRRKGSSSDNSHSAYTDYSFSRNPSTSSSHSHDHSSSSSHSYQAASRPIFSNPRMPENGAPSAWKHRAPVRPRADSDAPPFSNYHINIDDLVPFTTSRQTHPHLLKSKDRSKLKKRRPATRDGYEGDGSALRNKGFGRASDPRSLSPVPAGRSRAISESPHTAYVPASSSPPAKYGWPVSLASEEDHGHNNPTYSVSRPSQARPSASSSSNVGFDESAASTPAKKKGFRWGFKRSQSHPDLQKTDRNIGSSTSIDTYAPPRINEQPPLPSLRISEVLNVDISDNQPTSMNMATVHASYGARGPADPESAMKDVSPVSQHKEQFVKAGNQNRAGIGARGLGGGMFLNNKTPTAVNGRNEKPSRPTVQTQGIRSGRSEDGHTQRQLETALRPYTVGAGVEREGSIHSEITIRVDSLETLSARRASEESVKTIEPLRHSTDSLRRSVSLDSYASFGVPSIKSPRNASESKSANAVPVIQPAPEPSSGSPYYEDGFMDSYVSGDLNSSMATSDPFKRITPAASQHLGPIPTQPPRSSRHDSVASPLNADSNKEPHFLAPRRLGAKYGAAPRIPGQSTYSTSPRSPAYSPGGLSVSSSSTTSGSLGRSTASPLLTPNNAQFLDTAPTSNSAGPFEVRGPNNRGPVQFPLTPKSHTDTRPLTSVSKFSKLRDLARALALDVPSPTKMSPIAPSIIDSVPSPITPPIVASGKSQIAPSSKVSPVAPLPINTVVSTVAPSPVDSVVSPIETSSNKTTLISPAVESSPIGSPLIDSFRSVSMYSSYTMADIDIPDYLHPDAEYEEMPVKGGDSDSVISDQKGNRFSAGSGFGGISLDDITRSSMHAPIFKAPIGMEEPQSTNRATPHISIRKPRPPEIRTVPPSRNENSENGDFNISGKTIHDGLAQTLHLGSNQHKNMEPPFMSFDSDQPSPPSTASSSSSRQPTPTNFTQRTRLAPRSPSRFTNSPKLTPSVDPAVRNARSVSYSKWL